MITVRDMTFRIAGRTLFKSASLVVPTGAKCGIVGRNGTGKSTLFKILTGEMQTESGDAEIAAGLSVGYVRQEVPGTETSVLQTVIESDHERMTLLRAAETETDAEKIATVHERLASIDAYSAEARAASILNGLGFTHEKQQDACATFSGGWRMRISLATTLFNRPDVLLLDEPTNYLDLEGTVWLETHLKRYDGTVLLISHDRSLLDACAGHIAHLQNGKLTLYKGNFEAFQRKQSEQALADERFRQKQADKRKHMEAFVERFRAKASKAKQAQSRLKALEKMASIESTVSENVVAINLGEPKHEAQSPIIALERASVGYQPKVPILQQLNLRLDADDRIALLGSNGNGKSTFAKLLSGELQNEVGAKTIAPKLQIAMFSQHQMDDLDPAHSAFEHFKVRFPAEGTARLRAMVAQIGLSTEKMDTPSSQLSGGEKARLVLGLMATKEPNLVILDEPTNHLDMESRVELVEAIASYPGAVIVISHDQTLVDAVADRLWIVEDGTVRAFEGTLSDYRNQVLSLRGGKSVSKHANGDGKAKADRKEAAQKRTDLVPLKQRLGKLETLMELAGNDIAKIDKLLCDPDVLQDTVRVSKLSKKRGQIETKKDQAEEKWLELSEEYETAIAAASA
ncbi:MAG: ABC-F family ATP-binding cassette domain-containing protein [Pseudomonadota bacterium]